MRSNRCVVLTVAASPCLNYTLPYADACPAPMPIINATSGPVLTDSRGITSGCGAGNCVAYGPQKATDHKSNGLSSSAITRFGVNPWMTFQLNGSRSDVVGVAVWARADGNIEQSSNLTVWMSPTTNFVAGIKCDDGMISPAALGERMYVPCPVTNDTQYVTVQRNTAGGWLSIQEIEVYYDGEW